MWTAASAGAFEDDDPPPLEQFMVKYGADVIDDEDSALQSEGDGGGYSWMQD